MFAILFVKEAEKSHFIRFFNDFKPFCYEQTSPLGVPVYAFGFPKAYALAQFVRSETFFPIPTEKGAVFYSSFFMAHYFSFLQISLKYL